MQRESTSQSRYQDLRLHEWIDRGRASGRITDVNTILLAYCMDERDALVWVSDIVAGKTTEAEALVFMERAVRTMQ